MKYQVLENNIPADCFGYPELTAPCWKNSIFASFEQAKLYAVQWCFNLPDHQQRAIAQQLDVIPNQPFYLGHTSMEIRAV